MAALPTDIIADILSRLPVNSLLRFKSVSKSWYSLIKSHNFIKLHLNRTLISNSDRHLLLFDNSFKHADFDLHRNRNHLSFSDLRRHPLWPHKVNILGSCNGVVCIADVNIHNIFLYNPLTKSHREIPSNPITNLRIYVMMLGFGYDSKSDDYKLLRIVQEYKQRSISYNEAAIYSVKNDSWKRVEGMSYNMSDASSWRCVDGVSYCLFDDLLENHNHGVLVDEGLHYIAFDEKAENQASSFIARFDLSNEKFSYMDCPAYKDDKFSNRDTRHSLSELGGLLCFVVIYYTDDFDGLLHPDNEWRQVCESRIMCRTNLWVLKEFGRKESWVKLFSIRQCEPVWCGVMMSPLFYSQDGRRILLHIDLSWFGWYDLESKTVERYTVSGLSDDPFEAGVFVGSLVSFQEKMHFPSKKETLPRKHKTKNDSDKFLSVGFKLKL